MKRVSRCHISEMLRAQKKPHLSFHTPGHKRAGADITELPYSDNLLSPRGVIARAEEDVAHIAGAERAFLLTDGSTSGVHAMLLALREAGITRVAYPAFSHKSVKDACYLFGLEGVEIASFHTPYPRQPSLEAIKAALEGAEALLLTSPDYYGNFPPLQEAAQLCKEQHKPLLLDGAHGAHLHGTEKYAGKFAQMWVDGAHKSLPALTQGAVVSARGKWTALLGESVAYFRTTSPSYPIMASIEYAVKYPRNERIELAAERAKRELGALENQDWSKIVLPFGDRSGDARRFLEARGVYPEFDDGNYLMFYLSPATRLRELKRLVRLVGRLPRAAVRDVRPARAAGGGKTIALAPQQAVGHVCAQACGLFPPCVPLLVPGDVVSEEAVRRLSGGSAFGLAEGKIIVYED